MARGQNRNKLIFNLIKVKKKYHKKNTFILISWKFKKYTTTVKLPWNFFFYFNCHCFSSDKAKLCAINVTLIRRNLVFSNVFTLVFSIIIVFHLIKLNSVQQNGFCLYFSTKTWYVYVGIFPTLQYLILQLYLYDNIIFCCVVVNGHASFLIMNYKHMYKKHCRLGTQKH